MKKPYIVLKSFYSEKHLDSIFLQLEDICLSQGMYPLNRGRVFPGLLRRVENSGKLLEIDRLVTAISRSVGYDVRATKHSEFQINTVGGWHTDLGDHRGGYLPPDNADLESIETKICRVAIFSRETITNRKCTQFYVDGVPQEPPVKYGDVLIFPPEQKHRATPANIFARLAFALAIRVRVPVLSKFLHRLESSLRAFENRRAIFLTTGASEGNITDFYEQKNIEREDEQINLHSGSSS